MISCRNSEIGFEEDDATVLVGLRGSSYAATPAIVVQFPLQLDKRDNALGMCTAHVDYSDERISQRGGYGLLRKISALRDDLIAVELSGVAIDWGIPDQSFEFEFAVALERWMVDKLESLCGRLNVSFERSPPR